MSDIQSADEVRVSKADLILLITEADATTRWSYKVWTARQRLWDACMPPFSGELNDGLVKNEEHTS